MTLLSVVFVILSDFFGSGRGSDEASMSLRNCKSYIVMVAFYGNVPFVLAPRDNGGQITITK